ncbi:MAG: hypothetical protein ABSA79_07350 [Candidatus Bathyarchaeia archaeon]|jgi:hypothetical protein
MILFFAFLAVMFIVCLIVFWLAVFNWFDSPFYSDDSLGCRLGGGFWSLYTKIFISGFRVYKALRFCFRVFLPFGGFGIVGDSVASVAKKRVVHFKDGTFKEYSSATKEQLDFARLAFHGADTLIDDFGEKTVLGYLGGFVAPVMDISPTFFRDLDCNGHVFEVVGHGMPLNGDCDGYVMTKGCSKVELHKEHVGLGFFHKIHHHCFNWRCPKCFFYGNAVRSAQHIAQRLDKKSKETGLAVEAGMVSVPPVFYGLSETDMRAKCIDALFARGLLGFVLVFHPLAYKSSRWVDGVFHLSKFYYNPHYHWLGFFKESYEVCRNCEHYNEWGSKSVKGKTNYNNHGGSACLSCEHFEGLSRRLREKDNFLVKVFSKRDDNLSVFRTCLYELSHCGFESNTKHVHIVTWVGNCSSRRFKSGYQSQQMLCPEVECKSPLVRHVYSGTKYEIVKFRDSPDYKMDDWLPVTEDGKVVWSEVGVISGE